jgi:hypothetical protein
LETIRERGTVIAVEGDACRVRLDPGDEARCRQCGLCAASAQKAEERRVLRVEEAGPRTVGEAVVVEVVQPNSAVAALAVFGLPSLGAGALAGLAFWASGAAGLAPTIPALGAGVLGAAAGLAGVKLADRAWRRRGAFRARIVEDSGGETEPCA